MKKPISVLSSLVDQTLYLVDGLVATDGVQYSATTACATGAAVEIFNKLVDLGQSIRPLRINVNLLEMFQGIDATKMGSLMYHWQARSEAVVPSSTAVGLFTGNYCELTGTYVKGVGTTLTVGGTFNGDVSVASLPFFPIRLRLLAQGAPSIMGYIKNASYVRVVGNIIPGT